VFKKTRPPASEIRITVEDLTDSTPEIAVSN